MYWVSNHSSSPIILWFPQNSETYLIKFIQKLYVNSSLFSLYIIYFKLYRDLRIYLNITVILINFDLFLYYKDYIIHVL